MSDQTSDEEYRQAQTAEYGTYVANKPIHVGAVLAFNQGDPVPVSHVEAGTVSTDDVAKTSTKAGKALTETSEA